MNRKPSTPKNAGRKPVMKHSATATITGKAHRDDRLSLTPDVVRAFKELLNGTKRNQRVGASSALMARMIQEEHARRNEEEREPINASMRAAVAKDAADIQTFARTAAASAGCIEGEFASGRTPAARTILPACHLAKRLAGLLEDTAVDLEGQLRKLAEAEAAVQFTVESVTKGRDRKLRCPVAIVRLAIKGREITTLRYSLHSRFDLQDQLCIFLRAIGYTLPARPDWEHMAGRSGRCRLDGGNLTFLIPAVEEKGGAA